MELVPDRVASMLETMGGQAFGDAILGLFDPELNLAHCAAYVRAHDSPAPRVIVATADSPDASARARELAGCWSGRDYSVDPLFANIESLARDEPQVHFFDARTVPGCTGSRAKIVERYYDGLGLGEEATFTVRDTAGVTSISLFKRLGGAGFSPAEQAALRRVAGLMLRSTRRHGQLLPEASTGQPAATAPRSSSSDWTQSRSERFARLRSALLMDPGRLTVREADICAYIVLGHTVLGISLMLDISVNTVATHRKRAYAKLGISSQTELFNTCLRHCG